MKNLWRYSTVFAAVLGLFVLGCEKTQNPVESLTKDNIVASIEKAPIVADGDVVNARTDLVINLNTSLDPAVPGRTLLAGRTIKVILPDEFVNTGSLSLQDIFSSPTCVPGNMQCTSAILLQGWPQHPLLPSVPPTPPGQGTPQYFLSLEGKNTIVFTALVDIIPGASLVGPGIKQIHLILNGFTNPSKPGFYSITVEAQTGPNGEMEQGMGMVQILPEVRPSINITCAFNQGAPNTIFQKTNPGQLTPLSYDFLLMGPRWQSIRGSDARNGKSRQRTP